MKWPMGDVLPGGLPTDFDATIVAKAVDAAFESLDALTAACVITWSNPCLSTNSSLARATLDSLTMG
jgi:hypothetical protein